MTPTSRFLVRGVVLLAALAVAASASRSMQAPRQLAPFNSVELPHGGHAIIRPAAAHRVTLVKGSWDITRATVTGGGVLVIDKCRAKCPRGYRIEVEITMPAVTSVSLANGGSIQVAGGFARQPELAAEVGHGGTVDVRSLVADRVTASVEHGGRIMTANRAWLFASVTQGGAIVYWGDGQVRSSVNHGGVVQKGEASELNLPLGEIGFPIQRVRRH